MAIEMQSNASRVERHGEIYEGSENIKSLLDDDGRAKRTGTWITASAHIITAVIGSGVLSLAWAIAQLGWVVGPIILVAFSIITLFTSALLVECYRSPDSVSGKRNYTYMGAVRANLGGRMVQLCGLAQFANMVGTAIGYIITASISIVAVKRSNCFHKNGHHAKCYISNNLYIMIFGCIQIILCQIPNFHKLSGLSVLAAVMSFAYSSIGLGLSIARSASGAHATTTSTGVIVGVDVSAEQKVWRSFQAIGDIAFAYAYSTLIIEIQDTLKQKVPENKVMKKASVVGISVTTMFYVLCGCVGYAAFGNDAPGNFLTGFGFYEPFWLVDLANLCIAIHLVGAYQVYCQPVFSFVETSCLERWPESNFIRREHAIDIPFYGPFYLNLLRLVWRTAFVIVTTVLAMIFPFFNDFLGLIGAISFWPLTVYFPIEMYITRSNIKKFSHTWIWLKILSWICLVVSLVAAAGSVEGLVHSLKTYKPFSAS